MGRKKRGPSRAPVEQEPGARTGRPAALARRLKTSTLTGAPKIREALADRRSSKDREHEQDAPAASARRLKKSSSSGPRTNPNSSLGRHREDILYKNNTTLVREENKNKVKKTPLKKKKKKKKKKS